MTFLTIGATSIGGGVVAYLRSHLVGKRGWFDDATFLEMLSISQTMPGLNATNMSVLAGDRLRGGPGAVVATLGMCLPGATIMAIAGAVYGLHTDTPAVTAALHGIAAAAVGLVFSVLVQIAAKALKSFDDYVFVAITAFAVIGLGLAVPYALLGVGALAIWWKRPRKDGGTRP
jgi:chromate transporter